MKILHKTLLFFSKYTPFENAEASSIRTQKILWGILAVAFVLRIAVAFYGFTDASLLMRPDSVSYINPAKAILADEAYNTAPGSYCPETTRTPGYPLFLSFCFLLFGENFIMPILFMACISTLTVWLTFYTARFFTKNENIQLLATAFMALNLTAIVHSPLILTDTFFAFFTTLQLFFFPKYLKTQHLKNLLLTIVISAFATYIRPANMMLIFPLIVVILFQSPLNFKKYLRHATIAFFIFMVLITPWMCRNAICAKVGFTFDTITGTTLYYNNAVAITAKVTGENSEVLREKWAIEADSAFACDSMYALPAARESYYRKQAIVKMMEYPVTTLTMFFRPVTLIPDVPTGLELLKVTTTGRGTFDVINREGLFAGIRHYFNGNYSVLCAFIPLILLVGFTYLMCGVQLFKTLFRGEGYTLLLFAAFAYYYIFIPGPVSMPRYQLPALPFIMILAAMGFQTTWAFIRHRKETVATGSAR